VTCQDLTSFTVDFVQCCCC